MRHFLVTCGHVPGVLSGRVRGISNTLKTAYGRKLVLDLAPHGIVPQLTNTGTVVNVYGSHYGEAPKKHIRMIKSVVWVYDGSPCMVKLTAAE